MNGEELPQGHPSASVLVRRLFILQKQILRLSEKFGFFVRSKLRKALPDGHPDVDDLFFDHEELPDWHPDLSLVVQDNPIEPIYVFRYELATDVL